MNKDRMNRIFSLHRILTSSRYPVPRARLLEELECSRATLTRILAEMRGLLGAPIEFDAGAGGYRYSREAFELPGLWFTPSELHALLAAQKLLDEAQPGLLEGELAPLRKRIERILASERLGQGELARRVRLPRMAARQPDTRVFQTLADATARRRRLSIHYAGRERGQATERDVSLQRLVHYRDNWYLDAWCHLRDDLRSFALERIGAACMLEEAARELEDTELDEHFRRSYGIFSGSPTHTAVLRFTPERARWVAEERWHADQHGRWLEDGRYELTLPYADPRELLLDILKYGPDVEVMAPEELLRIYGAVLTLTREPHNRHDCRAIRVDWQGHKLGYVPRVENATLASLMNRGYPIEARITELREDSNPWLRVEREIFLMDADRVGRSGPDDWQPGPRISKTCNARLAFTSHKGDLLEA